MSKTFVVIMAGGIGSRFWPKSRAGFPKQFLDILGMGKSLLQMTFGRFAEMVPREHIYIITNEQYKDLVKEQIPDLNDHQILLEPVRRNTAPCVAYACNKIAAKNPEATIVVAPSDHLVLKEDRFAEVIQKAIRFASDRDALVTLGIRPLRPDTGYGYIQFHEEDLGNTVHKVKTFTEKPNLELARTFLKSGDFLWNSGIFVWSADSILSAFQKHQPELAEIFSDGKHKYHTDEEAAFLKKAYSMCTNISIDYGVMEKSENVFVIPSDFGWSDLGTWASLYEVYDKDYLGNAVSGKQVMVLDAKDCMVMAPEGKLVVLQGLDGFCVIDTGDVLLICEMEKEQEIKQITADIKARLGDKFL